MSKTVGVIGGGPAGLMAAEVLSSAGLEVSVFDAMPTVGRKFLMAGKSGLNLTHSDLEAKSQTVYGQAEDRLRTAISKFGAEDIRQWCQGLGIETFYGSSGRLFPKQMKASPLLRAWIRRLAEQGVTFAMRHRLTGRRGNHWVFATPDGEWEGEFNAVVLALGGASWPRLGSDARWVPWLAAAGIEVSPFRPANCGFEVAWSSVFRDRFAGAPVKSVTATTRTQRSSGEFVITQSGIEGGLVYEHSSALREQLEASGTGTLLLDLAPDRKEARIAKDLERQPSKSSLSNRLRKGVGLDAVKIGLLREFVPAIATQDLASLVRSIKAMPLVVTRTRPLAEAISTAGGVAFSEVDSSLMLNALPGVFVAGEMLDWEAPTGGYLLTACFATGQAAGHGAIAWLGQQT